MPYQWLRGRVETIVIESKGNQFESATRIYILDSYKKKGCALVKVAEWCIFKPRVASSNQLLGCTLNPCKKAVPVAEG